MDAAQVVAQARAFADGVILELGKHGGEAGLAPAFGAAAGTQGPLPRPAGKSFGQLGYERFSEVYSWDSEDGVGLPPWGELDAAKKTQWEAAAEAIRAA